MTGTNVLRFRLTGSIKPLVIDFDADAAHEATITEALAGLLVQLPDGTYIRKPRKDLLPDDMLVSDGSGAFDSDQRA